MAKTTTKREILEKHVQTSIASRAKSFMTIIEALRNRRIDDMVVPTDCLAFDSNGGLKALVDENGTIHNFNLTNHSASQIAERLGLPPAWVYKSLTGQDYYREAVAFALNKFNGNYEGKDDRFLFRSVGGDVKGILSTAYRRMNTKEIFEAFLEKAMEMNLTLLGAFEGDSRDYIEVIDPNIRDIKTPNNGIVSYCRGAVLKNSDFGDGRLSLASYNLQAVCMNGLVGNTYMKEVSF